MTSAASDLLQSNDTQNGHFIVRQRAFIFPLPLYQTHCIYTTQLYLCIYFALIKIENIDKICFFVGKSNG